MRRCRRWNSQLGSVASFIEHNKVGANDLPVLITTVHRALTTLERAPDDASPQPIRPTAGQIKKSITPEALISFEDGRSYRLLKRHLSTLGLTPQQYRDKWGLPADYPMTAPSYAQKRSDLAKAAGLGQGGRRGRARSG